MPTHPSHHRLNCHPERSEGSWSWRSSLYGRPMERSLAALGMTAGVLWKIISGSAIAILWACAAAGLALAQPSASLDPGDSTFKLYALSLNAKSLNDPDDTINREWTNVTAESLPDLITAVPAEGYAVIRSKTLFVDFKVPLGWHAIEDFERLAIFNPDRSVRIIVWRVDLDYEGEPDLEKFMVGKAAALRVRYPVIQASSRTLPDGQVLGVLHNVPARKGDKEPRAIVDLLTPNPENSRRALLMTFGAPMSRAQEFLPLLALMARDRKITWKKDR